MGQADRTTNAKLLLEDLLDVVPGPQLGEQLRDDDVAAVGAIGGSPDVPVGRNVVRGRAPVRKRNATLRALGRPPLLEFAVEYRVELGRRNGRARFDLGHSWGPIAGQRSCAPAATTINKLELRDHPRFGNCAARAIM